MTDNYHQRRIDEEKRLVRMLRPDLPINATCLTCEYYLYESGSKVGDCLNANAARFQRQPDEVCRLFVQSHNRRLD